MASARNPDVGLAPVQPLSGFVAPPGQLVWMLGLGAFGLAWSITTVAAYLPPVLEGFTDSSALIGLVLASEGAFALLVPLLVGPMSDATETSIGRRRPFMLLALPPMAVTLAAVAFMPDLMTTALALCAFFFAYYVYEPPYRGLYPDCLPATLFGSSQGVQHVYRGVALGGALVGGGILLDVWKPFPFVLAAAIALAACGAVIVFVREPRPRSRQYAHLRTYFLTPWRIVRGDRNVRRFLIANTAWEATFAGMRTFVVLYVVDGLEQPLYVSSAILAVIAVAYLVAAAASARFGDRWGLGNVILGASVVYGIGLLVGGLASEWRWWYLGAIAVVALAAGTVMTLAWGLLFKLMPPEGRGAVAGLATMTKGLGLLVGPLAVGGAVDLFAPVLESTEGYAIVWPTVAIPILAAIPLVTRLAEAERLRDTGSLPA
ncbi:MAG: MFS transporter [Actinomycetota bacterium]|nr:MFS transporter [Actinomycetota bacterium]